MARSQSNNFYDIKNEIAAVVRKMTTKSDNNTIFIKDSISTDQAAIAQFNQENNSEKGFKQLKDSQHFLNILKNNKLPTDQDFLKKCSKFSAQFQKNMHGILYTVSCKKYPKKNLRARLWRAAFCLYPAKLQTLEEPQHTAGEIKKNLKTVVS